MGHLLKLSLLLLCLSAVSVFGQVGNITGKINGSSGEGLIGAIAELRLVKDSSLTKAAATDVNGAFVLENIKAGSYYIKASFIGFNSFTGESFSFEGSTTKNVSTIRLSESSIQGRYDGV
jgi:iron complex outermembrane recepter protein